MTITKNDNPIELFREWLTEAEASEPVNPNAMALATSTPDGKPSVRMVLLKGVDEKGFVFYTNTESRKGRELVENMEASLCFYWKSLARQVRVDGTVETVTDEEADAYFASRDRMAKIGAWASKQSHPMEGTFELEKSAAKFTAKFNIGDVPRPEFWSGYRVIPHTIEFWKEQLFRLHDRLVYYRADDGWTTQRLFP